MSRPDQLDQQAIAEFRAQGGAIKATGNLPLLLLHKHPGPAGRATETSDNVGGQRPNPPTARPAFTQRRSSRDARRASRKARPAGPLPRRRSTTMAPACLRPRSPRNPRLSAQDARATMDAGLAHELPGHVRSCSTPIRARTVAWLCGRRAEASRRQPRRRQGVVTLAPRRTAENRFQNASVMSV
jgi:hypothetical protein